MNIVKGLDENKRFGEKGHIEYGWSGKFNEKITQFYFQLVRTKNMTELNNQFKSLLLNLKSDYNEEKLILLFKITANCRDVKGKGERDLSYMMLYNWWLYEPRLAYYLFETFLVCPEIDHPYGSWMDVKKMCDYIRNYTNDENHEFIKYIVKMSNYYLKQDYESLLNWNKTDKISLKLAGKWLPREKSKYSWLHKKLAMDMFPHYLSTCKSVTSNKKAILKCKINYTKMLTVINKYLDTAQIKMCNNNWKYIDFNNVTSKTLHLQKLSFMNLTKKQGKLVERSDVEDRKKCADNLKNHLEQFKKDKKTIKGKRCNVYEFVKDALIYSNMEDNKSIVDIINEQWKDNSKQNGLLGNIIPMADTSGSMEIDECIPLYNSIGLSIRVSEKTHPAFKNRILTFESNPSWVQLDESQTFCEKVKTVRHISWGGVTDIYKAMKLICDTLIINNIHPEEVENLVLAIFSDMQIDCCLTSDQKNTLYDNIKLMFNNAGLETSYKKPYNPPHILFWNLRQTQGFPTSVTEKNVTMLSGYNAMLLNAFCEKGMEGLKEMTPIKMLDGLLSNKRYIHLEEKLKNILHN